jgi:hypothetical protein
LALLGLVRSSGETVSAFARRVKLASEKMLKAEPAKAGAASKIERRQREIVSTLKLLDEYEKNRWRNS